MVLNITANQQYLRVLNRYTVFEEISKNGALSRADLQKKTGLTATAISNIVSDLLHNRLIVEYDGGLSTGGETSKTFGGGHQPLGYFRNRRRSCGYNRWIAGFKRLNYCFELG